jgi:hypothetical protein
MCSKFFLCLPGLEVQLAAVDAIGTHCTQLHELTLELSTVPDADAADQDKGTKGKALTKRVDRILRTNPSLSMLSLLAPEAGDSLVDAFSRGGRRSLEFLDLSGCGLSNGGLEQLHGALKGCHVLPTEVYWD